MQLTEGGSSAEDNAKIQQDMKDQMSKMNSEIGSLKDMMKNFLASQSVQIQKENYQLNRLLIHSNVGQFPQVM